MQFATGLLAWSLAEYLVHRFLLHRRSSIFWPEHMLHHRSPLAEVGVPLTAAALVATLSMLIAWSVGYLGFAVGAYVGYIVYVSVHEAVHRTSWRVLRYHARLHDVHHKGHPANYGVSTPLWDIVFGTYRSA